MAGITYNAYGWDMLNWVIFPVSVFCLLALGWLVATTKRQVAA
jgi:hypothetical protein